MSSLLSQTYTDIPNALTKLVAWAVSEGWTDKSGDIAAGTQLYKQIGGLDCYFNFQTFTTKTDPFPHVFEYDDVKGIAVIGSTGTSGNDWINQPGFTPWAFDTYTTTPYGGCIDDLISGGGECHFFSTDTTIAAIFKTESVVEDWRGVVFGTVGGKQFYWASGGRTAYTHPTSYGGYDTRSNMFGGDGYYATAGVRTDLRNACALFEDTYWVTCNGGAQQYGMWGVIAGSSPTESEADRRNMKGSVSSVLVELSPDKLRGNTILCPVEITCSRDVGGLVIPVGELEGVRVLNMKYLYNEVEITYATDTYKCFKMSNYKDQGIGFLV